AAVRHHRREHLLVLHAVTAAGLEVLHAVRRRRVDDAGAGIERHVLAEIDRCLAVVERMLEPDLLERLAFARADAFPRQREALEARFFELAREDEQALLGIDE